MDRRTLIYGSVLGVLCVAIVVVVVLILRKRATVIPIQTIPIVQQQKTKADTSPPVKMITSYTPERPFQPGDPIPKYPDTLLTEYPEETP